MVVDLAVLVGGGWAGWILSDTALLEAAAVVLLAEDRWEGVAVL